MFANRISSSTSCSICLPETSPPSSSRGVVRHHFQSCNTSDLYPDRSSDRVRVGEQRLLTGGADRFPKRNGPALALRRQPEHRLVKKGANTIQRPLSIKLPRERPLTPKLRSAW